MYIYSSSISLVTHSLIHTLNQAIMHTYVTLEPQTSANQMRLQPEGKESMGLSRYHARLVRMKKKDGWMLVDNKSTNGTYVNSIKIAQLKPYVTAQPDVRTFVTSKPGILVMASDGIWDVLSSKDVHEFVCKEMDREHGEQEEEDDFCIEQETLKHIGRKLTEFAKEKGSGDNITVIVANVRGRE